MALLVWFGVRTLSGAESFTTKAAEEKEEAGEVLEEGSFKDKARNGVAREHVLGELWVGTNHRVLRIVLSMVL